MESSEIIRKMCAERGTSVTKLEKYLGFGNGSLTKGKDIRSDRLYRVAQFFGVTMEYLLTGENPAPAVGFQITPFEYQLIFAYRKADPIDQNSVDRILHLEEAKKEACFTA